MRTGSFSPSYMQLLLWGECFILDCSYIKITHLFYPNYQIKYDSFGKGRIELKNLKIGFDETLMAASINSFIINQLNSFSSADKECNFCPIVIFDKQPLTTDFYLLIESQLYN